MVTRVHSHSHKHVAAIDIQLTTPPMLSTHVYMSVMSHLRPGVRSCKKLWPRRPRATMRPTCRKPPSSSQTLAGLCPTRTCCQVGAGLCCVIYMLDCYILLRVHNSSPGECLGGRSFCAFVWRTCRLDGPTAWCGAVLVSWGDNTRARSLSWANVLLPLCWLSVVKGLHVEHAYCAQLSHSV